MFFQCQFLRAFLAVCSLLIFVLPANRASAKTRLFIVAGQSNASGRAFVRRLSPELRAPQPEVLYWYDTDRGFSGNRFDQLRALRREFGPELEAGRILAAQLTDEVAIVKVAIGGTTLAQVAGTDWSPDSTGELYDDLIGNVIAAKNALISDGKQVELAGLFLDARRV